VKASAKDVARGKCGPYKGSPTYSPAFQHEHSRQNRRHAFRRTSGPAIPRPGRRLHRNVGIDRTGVPPNGCNCDRETMFLEVAPKEIPVKSAFVRCSNTSNGRHTRSHSHRSRLHDSERLPRRIRDAAGHFAWSSELQPNTGFSRASLRFSIPKWRRCFRQRSQWAFLH
jgi:hypothetical protein